MVTLAFVYTAMHCGCMLWCLLNIKALGCGTELLLGQCWEDRTQRNPPIFYYFGADVLEQGAVAVPVHGLALTPELIWFPCPSDFLPKEGNCFNEFIPFQHTHVWLIYLWALNIYDFLGVSSILFNLFKTFWTTSMSTHDVHSWEIIRKMNIWPS